MKTLVIYDTAGKIFYRAMGDVKMPEGIPFMNLEIPEDKQLVAIDTSKAEHEPIYEDVPKSAMLLLQEQVTALNIALAEMMGV